MHAVATACMRTSATSSAWLERLPWEQEARGSNPLWLTMMPAVVLEAGAQYNDWTVVQPGTGHSICECTCGIQQRVRNFYLLNDKSRSCRDCSDANRGARPDRMFASDLPPALYRKFSSLVRNAIARCTNPDNWAWEYYGARGIQVCEQWLANSQLFFDYVQTLPGCCDRTLTLDREDNDGHYEPGNLRFVTRTVSVNNRRCSYAAA